uniref:Endonuclease/exonuclease/phosphatase domain-containing protein n=1 Tax=viral metagenome TaxID=1070528 RepID=A0A6C0EYS7_9ZZZZ
MNKLTRKISRTVSRTSSRTKSIKNNKNSNYHNKPINILSYNVSWESTSGQDSKWPLCSNNSNPNSPKHFSVCVNNIASVFDSPDYELDFITLQEAKNYKNLIKQSQRLKKMKYELHKSGLDIIATFWNDHVAGHKMVYTIKGEFEKGRPWMAIIFNNGLCLVNVHFGHYNEEEEMEHLEKMMAEIKKDIEKKGKNIVIVKRFIISGDFNYDIKKLSKSRNNNNGSSNSSNSNNIILNNNKFFYNPKHILTCCVKRRRHYDHVLDTIGIPIDINIPDVNYMASDHKPILVSLI